MANKFPDSFQADKGASYLDYRRYFSVDKLWEKVANVAKKAGLKAIYAVLLLYYTSVDSNTPWQAKGIIYGALGYFIFPLDFIPDAVPIVGFSDDMAALTAVLKTVWDYITPSIHDRAFQKLRSWFPDAQHDEVRKIF